MPQLPGWAAPAMLGATLLLLSSQVCSILYLCCCRRARYEGRTLWYRGDADLVLDDAVCCSGRPPRLTQVMIDEVQHDLRLGRAYWSGRWARDYRFHVANCHPLLSIFCCHPLHPYGKLARVLVAAITLAFMAGWRTVVQKHIADDRLLPQDLDEEIAGSMGGLRKLLHVHVRGQAVIFTYVTLPSMVAELLFTRLATLHDSISDFRREYGDRSCCAACATSLLALLGWLSCALFYLLACLSLGVLVYAVRQCLQLKGNSEELFYFAVLIPQSLAQIWSVWWFVFDLLSPYCGFGLCHVFQRWACLRWLRWQWWLEEEALGREPRWRVADTAHARFGLEVDEDLAEEGAAVLRQDTGLIRDRSRWVAVERVAEGRLEAWLTSKMLGAEKGHELLTQAEAQRLRAVQLRDEECVELLACCFSKRTLGAAGGGGPSLRGAIAGG